MAPYYKCETPNISVRSAQPGISYSPRYATSADAAARAHTAHPSHYAESSREKLHTPNETTLRQLGGDSVLSKSPVWNRARCLLVAYGEAVGRAGDFRPGTETSSSAGSCKANLFSTSIAGLKDDYEYKPGHTADTTTQEANINSHWGGDDCSRFNDGGCGVTEGVSMFLDDDSVITLLGWITSVLALQCHSKVFNMTFIQCD
ncbi:hypothetical protein EDC01DRAFT_634082 [Geopyxis carbonaria]|nr:hypothetical protein EDC01DRAFT_634082 [Geopyxis carbonaria]